MNISLQISENQRLRKMNWPDKVNVIGVNVSRVDYAGAVDAIANAAALNEPGIVSCHAVHAIVTTGSDPVMREMVNQFSMITPDGQPVRWAMNLLHRTGLCRRVYGPQLMLEVCRRAEIEQIPIYLYGGSDQVSEDLVASLKRQMPDLIIAGAEAPPFRPLTASEDQEMVERVNNSGAKIIFVGLGCPKQDVFAFEHRDTIEGIQICVGAAFDFHAGALPMAPQWMQRSGLEWVYRLSKEPGRLWRRYLYTNSSFVIKVGKAFLFRSAAHNRVAATKIE